MCCEMSHPRARPLPWLISRDEIQLNAPQSLLVLSILMVCAEHKEAVRRVGWKAGKQLKSILCQQRLPGEELGALQVPPTLCTRTGRTGRLGSVKPLDLFLHSSCGTVLLRVHMDAGGHAHWWAWDCIPPPHKQRGWRGSGWLWLWPLQLSSLLLGQWWLQPTAPWFLRDSSTLRSSGGRSCQPSVLLVFPDCCSWWHCLFCKQHRPLSTQQQKRLGRVNPQKLRNGGWLFSASFNWLASISFLLIHQQCSSVFAIFRAAYTCSVRLIKDIFGFAPSGQPFPWMTPSVW